MKLRIILAGLGVYEATDFGLYQIVQSEVLPSDWAGIVGNFPVLAVVLVVAYFILQWSDKMISSQRDLIKQIYDQQAENTQEIYSQHQDFVETLLLKMETRQDAIENGILTLVAQVGEVRRNLESIPKTRSSDVDRRKSE